MGKRQVNKQQRSRIDKLQSLYREAPSVDHLQGLVVSRFGRHAEVEASDGKVLHCAIRPNIDSLVAGDRVIVEPSASEHYVVVSRFPRQSELSRLDRRGQTRPVAANISQVFVVMAVKPELSLTLLDSYLVMLEHLGLEICIILNKVDLACEAPQQKLAAIYSPLGYRLLFTSQVLDRGFDTLRALLQAQTSVFVGQSGVGKSSIISHILPQESIQTAAISEGSELGRHTTSNSRLYHLDSGGDLIDSPGVREFSIGQLTSAEIIAGFPEFRPLVAQCKFRNCNHIDAPGCAIEAYVAKTPAAKSRYESLIYLLNK